MGGRKILDGRYEIISEIKRGGFGIIYYGIDRHLGKAVAIKEIDPNLLEEARYIDMFQAEAQNAAQLSHPNIAHIYDLRKTEDGHFYIIMEYIDGVDLGRMLRQCKKLNKRMPINLGVFIVSEVCKALNYAHNRKDMMTGEPLNLVHQDVSPSNIMISVDGAVKLIDFGIARVQFQQISQRGGVLLQGKIPYLSPEQLDGTVVVDRRSDIFALGAVFYEILTGERLFQGAPEEEILESIYKARVDLKTLEALGVPKALQQVLQRALKRNPDERYQSADLMYADLAHYLLTAYDSVDLSQELGSYVRELFELERKEVEELPLPEISFDIKESEPGEFAVEQTGKEIKEEISLTDEEDIAKVILGAEGVSFEEEVESALRGEKKPEEKKREVKPQKEEAPPAERRVSPTTQEPSVEEEEKGEDELKTIIDVVRLSRRSRKKTLIQATIGLLTAFIVFSIVDTFARMTGWGKGLYDRFFPPAIRIVSVPAGAQIFLDDKPLGLKTPASIPKISPGVHKLTLKYPGYPPLVRSITVPSKGVVDIEGETGEKGYGPYLFRFVTRISFRSNPPGAWVYLNGIRYDSPTPCEVEWEVGVPLSVEMEKAGFERLAGFFLNTLNEMEEIEDRRFWRFQRAGDVSKRYTIEGIFRKLVRIESIPSEAQIYLDGHSTPIGLTGTHGDIYLTVGTHEILLRKEGFVPRSFTLEVNENTPAVIAQVLNRKVRFLAKDITDLEGNDIRARLVRLVRGGKSYARREQTPCEIELPPYSYEAVFRKEGYKDLLVHISPSAREVIARMEPVDVPVTIEVRDALTEAPLEDARLTFRNLDQPDDRDKFLGQTDKNGKCEKRISPGTYLFVVRKSGYSDKRQRITVALNNLNHFVIRLTTQP